MKFNLKLIGIIAISLFSFSSFGIEKCSPTNLSPSEIGDLRRIISDRFVGKVKAFFKDGGGIEIGEGQYSNDLGLSIPLGRDFVAYQLLFGEINFQYRTKNNNFIRDYFWDESGYHHRGKFIIEFKEKISRDWEGTPIKKTCSLTFFNWESSGLCLINTSQDNYLLGCFSLFEKDQEIMPLDMNLPLVE